MGSLASRSEATVEAAGFIGVPGKPLLLAGVIFNPPKNRCLMNGL
jgi:hypothetical protein